MTNETDIDDNQGKQILHDDGEVNRILHDDKVYHVYQNNQNLRPQIVKAAEILKSAPNAVALVRSAVHAIERDKVTVFFSYKERDEDVAVKIINTLRSLTGGKLDIRFMKEFPAGVNLKDEIHKHVSEAHWFILLLPDKSEELDWCLFETGLFEGKVLSPRLNKLFCLHHHKNKSPDQIKELLSVAVGPGKASKVKDKFLRPICWKDNFFPGLGKLAAHILDDDLSQAAEKIDQAVVLPAPKVFRRRYKALARIHLDDPSALKRLKDLTQEEKDQLATTNDKVKAARPGRERNNAIFEVLTKQNIPILNRATFEGLPEKGVTEEGGGINERALRIFGKEGGKPADWKALVSHVVRNEKNNNRWLGELCVAIKDAVAQDIPTSIEATFIGEDREGSVNRPVLYAVDTVPEGGAVDAFFVLFIEEISAPVVGGKEVPESYQDYVQIASSIRLGYRFRWEVVEQFKEGDCKVSALEDTVNRAMKESESRLGLKVEELPSIFAKYGEKGKRVEDLYNRFIKTLGTLDALIAKQDIEGIQRTLTEFAPVNQEYLHHATELFADMNKRMLNEFEPSSAGSE